MFKGLKYDVFQRLKFNQGQKGHDALMRSAHHFIEFFLGYDLKRNTMLAGQQTDFLFRFAPDALLKKYFFHSLARLDSLYHRVVSINQVIVCHRCMNF